jgi:hypothetical protein
VWPPWAQRKLLFYVDFPLRTPRHVLTPGAAMECKLQLSKVGQTTPP